MNRGTVMIKEYTGTTMGIRYPTPLLSTLGFRGLEV